MLCLLIVWYLLSAKIAIYFGLFNCFVGVALYLKVSKRYYRPKKVNDIDIHILYPGFRRHDQCPSLIRIIVGLNSFVYLKLIGFFLVILISYFIAKISNFISEKDIPFHKTKHFDKTMAILSFCNYSLAKIAGIMPKYYYPEAKVKEVYKKYLGPNFDYDKELKSNVYATVICNHIGWVDIFYLQSITKGSFCAKRSVKSIPLVGKIVDTMETVWIDRANKENNKDAFVAINTRQEEIMKGEITNKMCIFPEGTGTNNSGLNQFKKGAFKLLNPCKPYVFLVMQNGKAEYHKSRADTFSIAAGIMSMSLHVVLSFCYLYFDEFSVLDLPVVTPNEFMYNNYSNLGKDNAEIYMNVCRLIMSEVSGLPTHNDESFETKLKYLSDLKGKVIKNT